MRWSSLLVAACSSVLFADCKAFDRAQYQALLDAHPLDAATGPGACLARSSLDDAGCTLAVAPNAPSALTDQPGDGRTYTLVLKRVGIGPGSFGNWSTIGFDLDQRCTTTSSELTSQSCRPSQVVTDGEEGRDNAFGGVIATGLLVLRTLDEREVNAELGSGRLALGLRVHEWGGGDDRQVRVEWLALTDGRAGTTDGGPLAWDGTDRWKVEPGFSFSTGSTPRSETTDAFVACDYSVARFSTRITIPMLSGGKLRMLTLDRAVLTGRVDGGAEASVEAGRDGGDAGPIACASRTREGAPGCTLAAVPTLPAGLPNVIGDTKVFVLRRMSLGAGGTWMTIGHDRDGLCTSTTGNDGGAPSVACRSPLVLSDGQNGRDNAFGSVIGQVGVFGGAFSESDLNASIEVGKATIGLRLRDFGGPNDGAMTVEMLPLYGGHAMGSSTAPPRWDGRDTWGINRNLAYTANGSTVRITSNDSFTSCGTVVMPFPNTAPLYFENDRIRSQLTLTDIRLVGQLDAMGNLTTADMSAIWSNTVIFDDLRTFGACRELLSANEWMTLLFSLSAALDITSTGTPNPAAECSAMSIGFRFELVPATLTGDVDPPPPAVSDPCSAAAQDAGTRG